MRRTRPWRKIPGLENRVDPSSLLLYDMTSRQEAFFLRQPFASQLRSKERGRTLQDVLRESPARGYAGTPLAAVLGTLKPDDVLSTLRERPETHIVLSLVGGSFPRRASPEALARVLTARVRRWAKNKHDAKRLEGAVEVLSQLDVVGWRTQHKGKSLVCLVRLPRESRKGE